MKWGYKLILFFVIVALLAPVISNNRPLLLISKGQITFPIFTNENLSIDSEAFYVMPLIPYRAGESDFDNSDFKSPFDVQHVKNNSMFYRHWMGTTLRGCDVLAGIISGSRYALMVGFCATLLSLIIGVMIGAGTAFSERGMTRLSIIQCVVFMLLSLFDFNLIFNIETSVVVKFVLVVISILVYILSARIKLIDRYCIKLNVELISSQITILFSSIPRLFFVIAIMGLFQQGLWTLIFLLGITGWMEIARAVRAEIYRIKSMDFYAAAELSGASWQRITIKQILPNLKPLLVTVFAFSFAGAILSEASLSFLGVGLEANQITWGSLILEGKESFNAWWLILFPGICISSCLAALFSIARNGNNDIYSL